LKSKRIFEEVSELKCDKDKTHSRSGSIWHLHRDISHFLKKMLSVFLASIILLSGMHFSVARHFCGDEAPNMIFSITGEKATCGMEKDVKTCPIHYDGLSSNCCRDEVSLFMVDNFDSDASFQIKKLSQKHTQVFISIVSEFFHSALFTFQAYTTVSPPDNITANAVSLTGICVFRI
jgi:hypothetical protein